MSRFIRVLLLLMLTIASVSRANEPSPRVDEYRLEVEFYPRQSRMTGTAQIRFAREERLSPGTTFYLHGELRVESMLFGGEEVVFSQRTVFYESDYSLVALEVAADLSRMQPGGDLTVRYEGPFHPSRASAPSDYMRIEEGGVYLRSYGYSLWFPVFLADGQDDYPVDFVAVKITTPPEMTAVFTGRRADETIVDGRRVSVWEALHTPLFDAQCSARRWDRIGDQAVMVYHLSDQGSTQGAAGILSFARRSLEFYALHFGAVNDRETTHIIQMPKYGDISSGNVSGISDESWIGFDDNWVSKYLLAHELVHPFVGRRISRSEGLWCFVIEGFPSYLHLPLLSLELGEEWYRDRIATVQRRYLEKRETGLDRRGRILPGEKPIDRISADEIGDYKDVFVLNDRAVLFLDYLRRRIGNEGFFSLCADLFRQRRLTSDSVRAGLSSAYPGAEVEVDVWLSTTEFHDWMRVEYEATNGHRNDDRLTK